MLYCGSRFFDSGSGYSISSESRSQVLKKKRNTAEIYFDLFSIKNCNFLMSKLQEKPSVLKREHRALQKIKFVNFFLCLWVIFALLNPDPDCEFESESRDPIKSGSNPDPDPQHGFPSEKRNLRPPQRISKL